MLKCTALFSYVCCVGSVSALFNAKLTADSALTARCCWAGQVQPTAKNARNHSQCDSMLIGDTAGANTYPYIQARLFPRVWHAALHGKAMADRRM